jgi:hypothetical protein
VKMFLDDRSDRRKRQCRIDATHNTRFVVLMNGAMRQWCSLRQVCARSGLCMANR